MTPRAYTRHINFELDINALEAIMRIVNNELSRTPSIDLKYTDRYWDASRRVAENAALVQYLKDLSISIEIIHTTAYGPSVPDIIRITMLP